MEFRALGPLRVLREGDDVDLGTPKQRAVFAHLLVNRNSAVTADRIIDDVWGDEADGKLNALRVYVSRLRDALEPGRERGDESLLETVGNGYRLHVADEQYDAAHFERLVSSASELSASDPGRAATTLRSALELWRGDAFVDVAYDEFAQTEIRRLDELRLTALEDRIDADLSLGRAGELVSELEVLRANEPLRERLVGQQALALYRSGRAADALRAIGRFRRHIGDELGIEPSPRLLRLEEQILLHDETIQRRTPEPALGVPLTITNPYKGLRAFGADDATAFFGRDALIARLLGAVNGGQRLIALVGASGSGKSSVVHAGLVPALTKGAIEGSEEWLVAPMVPGAHPFAELEAALLRSTFDAPASLAAQLDDGESGLVRAALRILPPDGGHLVVVIDQFEELFTLVDDEPTRDRFLANLVEAVDDPHGRITVVVTLRADFYAQPLAHPQFGARLGDGIINVTSMAAEELEVAALRPAEERGVSIEPALVGQLIADVMSQPGSLPLFQYALTELFDRRDGNDVTAESYRSMGGLDGALERRATDLFDELDDEQQTAVRQLFLRLVVVGDDDRRTRRRVPVREVASLGVDTVVMHDVLARYGAHRLLTFDSDPLTGAPTIEVAHESLLSAWPQLDAWIEAGRDDLRRHASLAVALREWQLSERDPDYLLPAARVSEFRGWTDESHLTLNEPEREFVDASAKHLAELAAEDEQRRYDEGRARRRLWGLVAALAAGLVVAGLFLFGVFAPDEGPTITYFGDRVADPTGESIRSGLERADRELRMQVDDVPWSVDPVREFAELAESDPEFVVTDAVALFASEIFFDHPDIRFGVIDPAGSAITTLPNVTYADFRNEEGSFLAGVAAAMTTQTNVVGFVGGSPVPVIDQFRAGFEAGVRAVDPEVEIITTFVDPFGGPDGFTDEPTGRIRATGLYRRDADVVYHAAARAGRGVFQAADEMSEELDRHLWAIGVDVDQWFDVPISQREHVLTSTIKRQDIAAYAVAERLLEGDGAGRVLDLGLAEGGYDYSTQGDAMSAETIEALDRFVADIAAGRVDVPTTPNGPVVILDADGRDIEPPAPEDSAPPPDGVDFPMFSVIGPGVHEVSALGTPLTVTLPEEHGDDGEWLVGPNIAGHTEFGFSGSTTTRAVVFLRPTVFADPIAPQAALADQIGWPAVGGDGLASVEEWLARLADGLVSASPTRDAIDGRDAVYFEVDVADDFECGRFGYCAGFLINTIGREFELSGFAFDPVAHHRVWVVDGGQHPPLVVIVVAAEDDDVFFDAADDVLASLEIGDPEPHPVDPADSGVDF